eukprot:tig00021518_g22021.t1
MEAQLQGGMLEIVNEGAAFLRRDPRNREFDIFMPPRLIRQFNLNNGDFVEGLVREASDHYRMSRPGQRPKPEMEDIMRVNGQSLRPDIIPNKDPSQLAVATGGMKRPFEGGEGGEPKRMDPGLEQFGVPGGDKQPGGGPLQMFQMKGYGFLLRNGQGLDIFVPPNIIRDYALKEQDYVFGMIQDVTGDEPGKHRPHLVEVISVNGQPAQRAPPMGGEGMGMGGMSSQHVFIDSGVLDLNQKRFGFLRENSAGLHVFVDPDTIRRSNLQQGDRITGRIQLQDLGTKRARLMEVLDVNGMSGGAAAAATAAAAAAASAVNPWQAQQQQMYGAYGMGGMDPQAYAAYAAYAAAYGYQMPGYGMPMGGHEMASAVPVQTGAGLPPQQQQQQQAQQQQQGSQSESQGAGDGAASGAGPSGSAPSGAVSGRPVSGTVRSGGVGGGPGLRVEASDGRQVAVAPAVAARFGLGDGDAVTGGCFELTAPAAGNEGTARAGPPRSRTSTHRRRHGAGPRGAAGAAARRDGPVPRAGAASDEAKQVHGLVADTPGGLRLVLQVYGYVHGPPAGAIVVPESTASSYSLKAGDYIRGLAGPDEAPADPNAPEGSKPPARKRFALRAVYHVEQGAR